MKKKDCVRRQRRWEVRRKYGVGKLQVIVAHNLRTHQRVYADMRGRIPSLRRIARRWEFCGTLSKEEFVGSTQAHLADTRGFQVLEWVDKSLLVRCIVPFEDNE